MAFELKNEEWIISAFLKSIGPWRNHVVIGGGYAPIIYKLYFDNPNMGNPPVSTSDLDTLIPRKLPQASKKNIARHLKDAGFKHVFKDSEQPATEAYMKNISGIEVENAINLECSFGSCNHLQSPSITGLPRSTL